MSKKVNKLKTAFGKGKTIEDSVITVDKKAYYAGFSGKPADLDAVNAYNREFVSKNLEAASDDLAEIIKGGSDSATAIFETGTEGLEFHTTVTKDKNAESGYMVNADVINTFSEDETNVVKALQTSLIDAINAGDDEE